MKAYETAKERAGHWQELARQAYIDGDMAQQARCHQGLKDEMVWMDVLQWEKTPTISYSRPAGELQEKMVPVGPHQMVQKVFHDRYLTKATSRPNADDNKELPKGDEGL